MVTVVIATRNRATSLATTLERVTPLAPVVVVDNGSGDATSAMTRARFPSVRLLTLDRNDGAYARNLGARLATTPYVAFCDDDCWWAPGSLDRAVEVLESNPHVGLLNARVLVGSEQRLDPACAAMAASTLPSRDTVPGRLIVAFMAGASVVRRSLFLRLGGFHRRYHIGAEESLLSIDLLDAGYAIVYCEDVVVHHHPSPAERDHELRRFLVSRNQLWTSWLRRPLAVACRETARLVRLACRDRIARRALLHAAAGLPWVLRERRVVGADVERVLVLVPTAGP
ncbi:MAG: glycosyltransferase [Candidatus Eremiobacteraeota bacterium]|nr:glycosyltransferase [Candidatus Eremiobacteraeota bacterium]